MEFLADLWLPILLSAVAVFVLSSITHMVLPFHRKDAGKLPGEEKILAAMREAGVQPGAYFFPACESMKDMGSDEMKARFAAGPVGHMTVAPSGPPAIGRSLLQWFVYTVVIGIFVAYAAHLALPKGAEAILVFRVTATMALLPYGIAAASESIWKMVPWGNAARFFADGLLYALATGAIFAWQWPAL